MKILLAYDLSFWWAFGAVLIAGPLSGGLYLFVHWFRTRR